MAEFKGTKGKWEIKHSFSKDAFNIIGTVLGGKYKVARVPYLVDEDFPEISDRNKNEAHADAKLIAASPELLESLQVILGYDNTGESMKEVKKIAEEAIKKATE